VAVAVFKKVFAKAVGITLDDASQKDMGAYPSLEALFVRRLRPGARPIDGDPDAVVSPVDALVGATGTVDNGTLWQIKGRTYSLARLLGDEAEAARFEGGAFATLYLAPRDYHRIHAPVGGQVSQARLIVGSLMPVFEESLNKVDELFARNERIITYMDTPRHGRIAVIKVGATLVGRIKVAYDDTLVGNKRDGKNRLVTYKVPKLIAKGGDLGAFELGSTVVLLAERGQMDLSPLQFGQRVFVGRRIGTLNKNAVKGRGQPPGGTRA
jgi:phosphatidylserine decarboxylase